MIMKKTSELCNEIQAGGTPETQNGDYYDDTIPWLRTRH